MERSAPHVFTNHKWSYWINCIQLRMLWPSDAIKRHAFGSALVLVIDGSMPVGIKTPSLYPSLCSPTVNYDVKTLFNKMLLKIGSEAYHSGKYITTYRLQISEKFGSYKMSKSLYQQQKTIFVLQITNHIFDILTWFECVCVIFTLR